MGAVTVTEPDLVLVTARAALSGAAVDRARSLVPGARSTTEAAWAVVPSVVLARAGDAVESMATAARRDVPARTPVRTLRCEKVFKCEFSRLDREGHAHSAPCPLELCRQPLVFGGPPHAWSRRRQREPIIGQRYASSYLS